MPFTVRIESGRARPVFVCDHCKQLIERAADGNLMWLGFSSGTDAVPFFTHKACCYDFEKANPGAWCSNDLDTAMVYIANNLEMGEKQWEKAQWKASQLARIG